LLSAPPFSSLRPLREPFCASSAALAAIVLRHPDRPHGRREAVDEVELAPLRVAQCRVALEQDSDRLHGSEAADHADHGAEHAIGGAGIAILRVRSITQPHAGAATL